MRNAAAHPTEIVLLGDPVAHSLSPLFQNAAIKAAGFSATYSARRVEINELESTLLAFRDKNVAGNVTIPHKEHVATLCKELSSTATRAAAVNTFWFDEGALVGDNTDIAGASSTLTKLVKVRGIFSRCLVVGAGGAAASLLLALSDMQLHDIDISARNTHRANALCQRIRISASVMDNVPSDLSKYDLIVNATPIGISGNDLPFGIETIRADACVFDLVYRRGLTPLVKQALDAGILATDGLDMLVAQGALSFEKWFGVSPDLSVMWSAVGEERQL